MMRFYVTMVAKVPSTNNFTLMGYFDDSENEETNKLFADTLHQAIELTNVNTMMRHIRFKEVDGLERVYLLNVDIHQVTKLMIMLNNTSMFDGERLVITKNLHCEPKGSLPLFKMFLNRFSVSYVEG